MALYFTVWSFHPILPPLYTPILMPIGRVVLMTAGLPRVFASFWVTTSYLGALRNKRQFLAQVLKPNIEALPFLVPNCFGYNFFFMSFSSLYPLLLPFGATISVPPSWHRIPCFTLVQNMWKLTTISSERVASKELCVWFLCSRDQLANIMTKPLPAPRFLLLRSKLTVAPAPSA